MQLESQYIRKARPIIKRLPKEKSLDEFISKKNSDYINFLVSIPPTFTSTTSQVSAPKPNPKSETVEVNLDTDILVPLTRNHKQRQMRYDDHEDACNQFDAICKDLGITKMDMYRLFVRSVIRSFGKKEH